VLVDLGPELDFLDLDDLLMFPGFARALLLLVLVLAEVHDPAYRRHGGRRDFHEVQTLLLRDGQRLGRRHDPELLPGIVNYANFAHANALVHSYTVVAAWCSVESDNGLLTLAGSGLRSYGSGQVWTSSLRLSADFLIRPGDEVPHAARPLIAARAGPDGNRPFGGFPVADDQHVRDLVQLG
jgi:hypothetical protein